MVTILKGITYFALVVFLLLSFCLPLLGPIGWGSYLADMYLSETDEEVKAGFIILLTAFHSLVLWEIVRVFVQTN